MGRVWGADAVAKNTSTSFYGNIVSLAESPMKEGLLYVGTDDGLVQVTEDGGGAWRKVETFPGVPANTYVSASSPRRTTRERVYASFDNHKMGDFKPYLLRSTRPRQDVDLDRGRPAGARDRLRGRRGPREDGSPLLRHGVRPVLHARRRQALVQLKGGMPTIAVRDLAIQKREGDLVARDLRARASTSSTI